MRDTQAAPLVGGLDLTDSKGLSQLLRYVLPDQSQLVVSDDGRWATDRRG
jgi:hypothetical protein